MNGALVHLAFNHIPVIGMPFCFLLLAGGLLRKSRDLVGAGFVGLILVALLTIVAVKSGGPAARLARNFPEVTRQQIHEHAEAADYGFWAAEILGAIGLLGLWFCGRGETPMGLATFALAGALFASTVFARIAHLGGLIRHPEIALDYQPPASAHPEKAMNAPMPMKGQ